MRRLLIAALVTLVAILPVAAHAQTSPVTAAPAPATDAPSPVGTPAPVSGWDSYYPIVLGAGAIAGVVAFNVLALGVEALPGGMAYAASNSVVAAEMSVAMSRVYAVTSAVAGALVANYLYQP